MDFPLLYVSFKSAGWFNPGMKAELESLVDNIRRLSIVAIDDDQETGDMNGWVMVSNEDLKNWKKFLVMFA